MSLRDLDIDEKGLWIVTDPDDFRANEQNYTLPRHISPKSTDYENLFKSPDDIKAEAEKELLAERDQKDTTLASAREQFQLPEEYGEEAKKGGLSQLGYTGTILKNLSLLAPTLLSKLPEGSSYVQPSAFRVTGRGIEEPPAAVPSDTPVLTSPEALLEDPTEKTTFRGDFETPQNIGGFAELDPADRLTAADQFSDSVAASEKGLKIIKDWLPTSGLDETQQKLVWEEVSVPSDYNALLPYEAQTKLQKSFEARQEWLRRAAYYSPQSDPDGTIFSRGYDQFVARPFTDGLTAIMSALEANMDTQTYLELQPTADERVIPVIESGDRVLQREKEKKARVDLTQGEIPDITSGDVDAAIAAGWLKPNYPTVLGEDQLKVGPFLPDAPEEERSPIPGAPKSTEALKIEVYNHRHKQARLNEETSYPFTEEIITPSYTQLDLEIDGAIALKVGLSLAALYATGGAAAPAVPAILGKGLAASLASKLVKPRQMTSRFLKSILSESDLRKVSAIIGLQNRTALRSKAERLAVDARETLAKIEEIVDVSPSQQAVAALTKQRAAVAQAEEALRLANRPVEKYQRYLDKLVSSEDSLRKGLTGISIEYAEFLAKMAAVTTSYNAAGTSIATLYENPEDMSFGEHLFFGLTGSIAAITAVRMGKSALFPDSLLLAKDGKKLPKDKLDALAREYVASSQKSKPFSPEAYS